MNHLRGWCGAIEFGLALHFRDLRILRGKSIPALLLHDCDLLLLRGLLLRGLLRGLLLCSLLLRGLLLRRLLHLLLLLLGCLLFRFTWPLFAASKPRYTGRKDRIFSVVSESHRGWSFWVS